MRASLTKSAGGSLDVADNIAPNMGLCANLFQSGEFRIANKTVSRVSDYMAQIDALETRSSKSKSWLDSVGNSTNWWQAEAKERVAQVSGDGELVGKTTNVPIPRPDDGYDVAGGALAERNQIAYVADTGLCTYAQGTDVNGLADLAPFKIGDYLEFTTDSAGVVPGSVEPDQIGIRCRVLTKPTATTMTVENLIPGNVATDGRNNWRRIPHEGTRQVKNFEMTWQPPLSIFKIGHAMPAGKYELVLNPQTSSEYKRRAVEALVAGKVPGVDFDFNITDMYLYIATVEGPRADDLTYLLDLEETRCQVDKVDGGFSQKNFDVSPSTFALTTAFQDTRAGSDSLYSSSKFKFDGSGELKLNRMFINYAGQNRPAPDADPMYDPANNQDWTIQRYNETQLYTGGYFDCGGAETIEEWHDRGAYYYFSWPRDGTDRSTRVNVHTGFTDAPASIVNARVLLFDHSKKVARVEVRDGRVVNVQLEDA
jgi:hypothetical protein